MISKSLNFLLKVSKAFFLPLLLISFPTIANSQDSKSKYPAYVDLTAKPGSQRNIGELNIMAPLAQNLNSMTFVNLRGQVDNNDSSEFNLGLGNRSIVNTLLGDGKMVFGYYGFLDVRNSENNNQFYQVTLGYEFLSDYLDFRNNYYAPINQEESISLRNQRLVEGNDTILMQYQNKEKALYGSDFEIGTNLPWLIPFNKNLRNQFRVYGGAYYFTNSDVKSIAGPRVRAELRLYDADRLSFLPTGSILTISGEYQEDNVRGDQKFSALRLSVPLQKVSRSGRLSGVRLRMIDPVVRDIDIVNSAVTSEEQAQFADGRDLTGVSVAGDAVELFNATTAGKENSIVVIDEDISTSLPNIIKSGQRITKPGEVIPVTTRSGVTMNYVVPGNVTANKTVSSTMPGQAPIAVESGATNVEIDDDVNSRLVGFDGTEINTNSIVTFEARSVQSLREGGIEAGTVLANVSTSDDSDVTVTRAESDFEINEGATTAAGCSNDDPHECLEVVGGQLRFKDGVVFEEGSEPNVVYVALANEDGTTAIHQVSAIDETSEAYTDIVGAGGTLPNQEVYKGVRLLYGSDFAANDGAKIKYVKHIISNLLKHDDENGGKIQAALAANDATMTLFNNIDDLDDSAAIFGVHLNSQDLQANETFPGSFTIARHGRGDSGGLQNGARDAALEEITHLIHNYGISFAHPEKQAELNQITQRKINSGVSVYRDADNDGIEDGNDLPRSDVDDELLSGAVEAYLNHTAIESAYYLDGRDLDNDVGEGVFHAESDTGRNNNNISQSNNLTPELSGESSHLHLRDRHSDAHDLVEGIFGPRDDLLTRLQQTPNP